MRFIPSLSCFFGLLARPVLAAEPESTPTAEGAAPKAAAASPAPFDLLTFHRDNYFLTGFTRRTQVKFQFSIKYDLWPSASHHTVYFAYTQKSLWDLYDRSSPFRESNYAPEVFYAHYHAREHGKPLPGCGPYAEQLGVEHESNGEAGEASRSWNRVFVNVEGACSGELFYGVLGLRVWYPFGLEENDDIVDTQGYGELSGGFGISGPPIQGEALLTLALRKGASDDLARGSISVNGRWRPTYERLFGGAWRFAPYAWAQFFTGYGESLGTYDRATTSVRLGLGFSDVVR